MDLSYCTKYLGYSYMGRYFPYIGLAVIVVVEMLNWWHLAYTYT